MPDPRFAGHIIRQTLQDVKWDEFDFLLLDFPPGTGEPQQTLLETVPMDTVLIVTTPQDLSLMDTSRSLGVFRQAGVPILGVIENMSYLHCPHCGERIEVFHRSEREWAVEGKELNWLGRIPIGHRHQSRNRLRPSSHAGGTRRSRGDGLPGDCRQGDRGVREQGLRTYVAAAGSRVSVGRRIRTADSRLTRSAPERCGVDPPPPPCSPR